jgi:mannose-1-phosphate guanylyltransferase
MASNNNYAVIMAGGIGSRFWPLSRTKHPKQFLDVLGTGKTLIQQTYERFLEFIPKENVYIIGSDAYRDLIKEQIHGIHPTNIISEPSRKNTAPCVAYSIYKISGINSDANVVIAPSDHVIMNDSVFINTVETGFTVASHKDVLLTLGIRPTRPDTGYGYIQYLEEQHENGAYKVKTFVEKPTLEIAKQLFQSGDYLWNAGIFIASVRSWHRAFMHYMPEVNDIFNEGKKVYNTAKEAAFIAKAYMQCPNVSIDIGIMEKAKNVMVIPARFGWTDLGTWASLYVVHDKDYLGNAVNSNKTVMVYDTTNSMIHVPHDKLVVLQGLEDYIVIDTKDVLLVCHKSKEQEIKNIVADIKRQKGDKYL